MHTQVRAANQELVRRAFRDLGDFTRPDYSDVVFDLKELLTDRARLWLQCQTEGIQREFLKECTGDKRHFRRLDGYETADLFDWRATRDLSDAEYTEYKQNEHERCHKLGNFIADKLYLAANRPGFMRRLLDRSTDYDVPEATKQEFKQAGRVLRHLRKPNTELRSIIRQLRNIK